MLIRCPKCEQVWRGEECPFCALKAAREKQEDLVEHLDALEKLAAVVYQFLNHSGALRRQTLQYHAQRMSSALEKAAEIKNKQTRPQVPAQPVSDQ